MANANKMTPTQARSYLAYVVASGQTDWRPTKDLSEYKDAQVERKAREFQRQEHAGLPIDNRVARGHGKSERGRAPKLQASATAYELARSDVNVQYTKQQTGKGDKYVGEIGHVTDADRALRDISHYAPGAHLQVKYRSGDGHWHLLYSKGGRQADALRSAIRQFDSFDEWLQAEQAMIDTDPVPFPDGGEFAFVLVA